MLSLWTGSQVGYRAKRKIGEPGERSAVPLRVRFLPVHRLRGLGCRMIRAIVTSLPEKRRILSSFLNGTGDVAALKHTFFASQPLDVFVFSVMNRL